MVIGNMPDRFLIDARFIIKRVADTFLGANLLTANGVDTTFTFGFVRDLLRMRQRLGIHAGAVVLGNALNETPDCDRQALLGLLGQLGVPRVDDPRKSAGADHQFASREVYTYRDCR